MTLRVKMIPHLDQLGGESGIVTVIRNYFRFLPQFDIDLVGADSESFDLYVVHAGTANRFYPDTPMVAMTHGLYWSGDYPAPSWEHEANHHVIESVRHADVVTVPSRWVQEVFERNMHFSPEIVPHGGRWQEWQHSRPNQGYILWNKNRAGMDVCNPEPVNALARAFPQQLFLTTFAADNPTPNIRALGKVVPHEEMRTMIQEAAVYLAPTKETWGIGIWEAMASGIPVLGYAHGGILDLVQHGVNGYLARPGDLNDLGEGLNYCLQYRDTLGANGREMAKQWTWEKASQRVAEVFSMAARREPPSVAAVIPSYLYGDKVAEAIESVLTQTWPVQEVIVVDDGSPDEGLTGRVVEEIAQRDDRVRYVRQENGGVAAARNAGIAQTRAKYIFCLDADDRVAPEWAAVCVNELERDRSVGVAYTGLYYKTPTGEEGISEWPAGYNFDGFLKAQNQVPTCALFRRTMWQRLGGYRQRYAPQGQGAEDAEFWLRAGAFGWGGKLAEPHPQFLDLYHRMKKDLKRPPEKDEMVGRGVTEVEYDTAVNSLFLYSWLSGRASGSKEYKEPNWRAWHPWVRDGLHPFASLATPENGRSHLVHQVDEPIVSVIIPVGPGHLQHLYNALDSLEAQKFRKWEAIVVLDDWGDASDDAPMPGYAERVIKRPYPFVRLLDTYDKRKSVGAGAARNLGVKHARGHFLLFLDADDWLIPEEDVLNMMLAVWRDHRAGAYGDYIGIANVKPDALNRINGTVLAYNEKRQEAAVMNKALEYDCALAQRQPEANPLPYVWGNITTLIPKTWHYEIGGFDEKMESWEDVDYWWRLARKGKCFKRIPTPIMTYRFFTGGRREGGRQTAAQLIQYLSEKYRRLGDQPIMCNCDENAAQKESGVNPPPATVISSKAAAIANANDSDFILIKYAANRGGSHRVVSQIDPSKNYNHRNKGEVFLVLKGDIALRLDEFRCPNCAKVDDKGNYSEGFFTFDNMGQPYCPVCREREATANAPRLAMETLAPPRPLIEQNGGSLRIGDWTPPTEWGIAPRPAVIASAVLAQKDKAVADLSISTSPLTQARVVKALKNNAITTAQAILDKGYDELVEIDGIGENTANKLIRLALEATR